MIGLDQVAIGKRPQILRLATSHGRLDESAYCRSADLSLDNFPFWPLPQNSELLCALCSSSCQSCSEASG